MKGGEASRYPVEMALRALAAMEHRGGTMPDGTGDGAGVLVAMPEAFREGELPRSGPPNPLFRQGRRT